MEQTLNPKKGEVWRVRHTRKGVLDVLLLKDHDPAEEWIEATVAQRAPVRALNPENDWEQGERIPLRNSFTTFVERLLAVQP